MASTATSVGTEWLCGFEVLQFEITSGLEITRKNIQRSVLAWHTIVRSNIFSGQVIPERDIYHGSYLRLYSHGVPPWCLDCIKINGKRLQRIAVGRSRTISLRLTLPFFGKETRFRRPLSSILE